MKEKRRQLQPSDPGNPHPEQRPVPRAAGGARPITRPRCRHMRRSCCWCGGRCTCTWTSRRFAESINQCLAALLSSGPRLGPVPECHSRHYQPCDRQRLNQRHAACNVNGTRCNGAMQCAWRAKWGGAAGLYTGLPSGPIPKPSRRQAFENPPLYKGAAFLDGPNF